MSEAQFDLDGSMYTCKMCKWSWLVEPLGAKPGPCPKCKWEDLGNGAMGRALHVPKVVNPITIWCVISCRVIPASKREKYQPSLIKRIWYSWKYGKRQLRKHFQQLGLPWWQVIRCCHALICRIQEAWYEFNKDVFPVETRTWGFYSDKDTAIQAVLENRTDLYEAGWYRYAVVEAVHEGLIADAVEQIFFIWSDNAKSDDKQGAFVRVLEPPLELVEIYQDHHIYFKFNNLG